MSFIKTSKEVYKQVKLIKEQSDDHEISMARGELEGIADKAVKLSSLLKSKSDAGNPIEAWVQSKITKAAEMVNSVHDYMVYNPEVNEAIDLKSRNIGGGLISQAKAIAKKYADNYTKAYNEIEKLQKGLTQNTEVQRALMQYNEEVELDEIKLSDIHKMQQDGKSSEDIAKELKLSPMFVKRILGEDREWTTQSNAKILNEFNDAQIALLKKEFDPLKNKQISTARANQLSNILDKLDDGTLQKLRDALIPFVSAVSAAKLTTRKFKGVKITNVKVPGLEGMAEEKIPSDYFDYLRTIVYKKVDFYEIPPKQIIQQWKDEPNKNRFKGKLIDYNESFKDNVIKKIVKPIQDYNKKKEDETKKEAVDPSKSTKLKMISIKGDQKEITIDKKDLEKYLKLDYVIKEYLPETVDEACWTGYKQVGLKKKGKKMVPNCVPEETVKEQKRLYIESIAAVKNKAEKTGMPYSILKQVYDRGMAAWKGGHRPGATQVQWALARVNSFVTKSSGTWGGADSDLAKKVKGKE